MKEGAKLLAAAAAAVLLVQIHRKEKERLALGWAGYGAHILGLEPGGPGRKEYLDRLRFLAAVLVILVHSMEGAASGIFAGQADVPFSAPPVSWYVLTGLSGVGLCCNLLFVMISGALLLPFRQESVGTFYRKRFSKVLIPLVLYYVFYLRRSGLVSFSSPASIGNALKTVLSGPVELVPHFWLVYVMTGLYIGVPFLRYLFKALPERALEGMAAVILAGSAAKTACYAAGISFGFDSFLFSWTGIFILGYFLTCPCSRKYRKWILTGGGLASLAVFVLFCVREDAAAVAANDSLLMILTASAVFLLFIIREEKNNEAGRRRMSGRLGALGRGIVRVVGRYSYSILLIHWYMLFVVVENHMKISPAQMPGAFLWAGILLQTGAALALSLIFAVIFDQTAGVLALWVWEKVTAVFGGSAQTPTR